MTFDEQSTFTETAMAAAFREAGADPALKRAVEILRATVAQPQARLQRFQADRQAWFAVSRALDIAVGSITVVVTAAQPRSEATARTPRRKLAPQLASVAAALNKPLRREIAYKEAERFLLEHDITYGEIDVYLRDSYVLRRIKEHYAGAQPHQRLREFVRIDVVQRFIDESQGKAA